MSQVSGVSEEFGSRSTRLTASTSDKVVPAALICEPRDHAPTKGRHKSPNVAT